MWPAADSTEPQWKNRNRPQSNDNSVNTVFILRSNSHNYYYYYYYYFNHFFCVLHRCDFCLVFMRPWTQRCSGGALWRAAGLLTLPLRHMQPSNLTSCLWLFESGAQAGHGRRSIANKHEKKKLFKKSKTCPRLNNVSRKRFFFFKTHKSCFGASWFVTWWLLHYLLTYLFLIIRLCHD